MKQPDSDRIYELNEMVIEYSTEIAALEKKILELQYEKEKIQAEIKRLWTKNYKHV